MITLYRIISLTCVHLYHIFIHKNFLFISRNISIIFYEILKNLRLSRDYTSFSELNSKQSKFIDFNCFRSFGILCINISNNKVFVSKEKKILPFLIVLCEKCKCHSKSIDRHDVFSYVCSDRLPMIYPPHKQHNSLLFLALYHLRVLSNASEMPFR